MRCSRLSVVAVVVLSLGVIPAHSVLGQEAPPAVRSNGGQQIGVPAVELPGQVRKAGAMVCPPGNPSRWHEVIGSHTFVIWYLKSKAATDEAPAESLKTQQDSTIWEKLTKLMGTAPVSDVGHPLEICLAPKLPGSEVGQTIPQSCDDSSAYIDVLRTLKGTEPRDVLAHEFMHATMFSMHYPCEEDSWWGEALSAWAVTYVYPGDKFEQPLAQQYLTTTTKPLNDPAPAGSLRPYGEYLFPYFLSQYVTGPGGGAHVIRRSGTRSSPSHS